MKKRIGNDFQVAWMIKENGVAVDLSTVTDLEITAKHSRIRITIEPYFKISNGIAIINFTKEDIKQIGIYYLLATYRIPDANFEDGYRDVTADIDSFEIVSRTDQEKDITNQVTSEVAIGFRGMSAFDVWRIDNPTGTTEQYFAYLRQPATEAATAMNEAEELRVTAETTRVENEQDRTTKEGLRQQAEQTRQTNTATAISNAENATDDANDAAILANEKAGLANEKAGLANDAAILANEKAGLAETATTQANDARDGANSAAQSATNLVNSYATELNGKVNTTDIEQVRSQATNKVPSSKVFDDELTQVCSDLSELDSSLDVYKETQLTLQAEVSTGHYRTLTTTSKLNAVGDNLSAKYYKVLAGKKYVITGSSQYLNSGWGLVYFQAGETIVPEGDVEILQPSGASTFSLTFVPTLDGYLFIQTIISPYVLTSTVNLETLTDEFIDFQEQINAIEENIDIVKSDIEDLSYVDIHIPSVVYAVVGDTLQLFYKSIINITDIDKYDIRFVGNVGKCFPRYFEFLPTVSDLGDKNIVIELKNDKGALVKSKSFTIKVVAAPISPISHVNIATFGDSLSFNGVYQHEAERRLISSDVANGIFPGGKNLQNISLVGTMDYLTTKYYGIGGWAWVNYATQSTNGYRFHVNGVTGLSVGAEYTQGTLRFVIIEVNITDGIGNILTRRTAGTADPSVSGTLNKASGTGDSTITYASYVLAPANPLWDNANNKMSYLPYINSCTTNGEVSLITFLLGWNILHVDLTPNVAYIKTLVETAHLEYPNATVALFGVQLPSLNGGLASNYTNNSLLSDLSGVIKMVHDYNVFLQAIADEYDYVDYIDIASQFDSENNMPESIRQVNIRNTKTELIGTNGVHPSDAGYYQIADVFYRYIVAKFCQ